MIRMSRAGGDVEERKRIEEENKVAKMITLQNLFAFCLVCGIIRAVPWALEQLK